MEQQKSSFLKSYQVTIYACYLGYIIQGIVNNINPILFVTYQTKLGITLDKIGLLIAANFGIQILVDSLSAKYVDKAGYRASMIFAHVVLVIGVLGIGVFPFLFSDTFAGLLVATMLNGIGGGLLEVLVSPIVEAAPGEQKDKAMSLLHSFYCWGCVGFVAISTLLLLALGQERWYFMPVLWAILPLINIFLFSVVPIAKLVDEEEQVPLSGLVRQKTFWILILLMLCAGASEMGMSQWASYFAETGLKVNKTVGDLLGPCSFCLLMGTARLFYGKSGTKVNLTVFMKASCALCIFSYLLASVSPNAVLGLLGCALCGLSVGIMWPGTFSIAAKECKAGGTALFALLALAGDIGCMSGPEVVSLVSKAFPKNGLKAGLLAAVVFPVVMLCILMGEFRKSNQ